MAKSKKTKENNTENIQEALEHTSIIEDETVATLFNEDKLCENPYPTKPDVNNLSISELIYYYEACKIICIQYEKEINLNELEKRNYSQDVIKHNREQYQKFTSIHRRLREIIENKVEKLTEYENW